jgi:putative phage-type endonuclease
MTLTIEQAEARRAGCGGSDIPAIMGLDPYRTIWDVWKSKVLPPEPEPDRPGADILRGVYGEPIAAQEYAIRHKVIVREVDEAIIHPRCTLLRGSLDRLIVYADGREEPLEIKCPRIAKFYKMKAEGLEPQYILQHQHYLHIGHEQHGWERGTFAIWCGEYSDLYGFPMRYDPAIGAHIEQTVVRFWEEYVLPKKQPPAPLPPPTKYPEAPGTAIRRDDEAFRAAADTYVHYWHATQEATRFLTEAEERLLAELAEDENNVVGAGLAILRYATTPQNRWQSKRFLADYALWQQGDRLGPPDPNDEAYYQLTKPTDKVKIKVFTTDDDDYEEPDDA